jgi:hypothetical protein
MIQRHDRELELVFAPGRAARGAIVEPFRAPDAAQRGVALEAKRLAAPDAHGDERRNRRAPRRPPRGRAQAPDERRDRGR